MCKKITHCPFCSSDGGYYKKMAWKYEQYYGFDGEAYGTSEGTTTGGIKKHCSNCNKDISSRLKEEP